MVPNSQPNDREQQIPSTRDGLNGHSAEHIGGNEEGGELPADANGYAPLFDASEEPDWSSDEDARTDSRTVEDPLPSDPRLADAALRAMDFDYWRTVNPVQQELPRDDHEDDPVRGAASTEETDCDGFPLVDGTSEDRNNGSDDVFGEFEGATFAPTPPTRNPPAAADASKILRAVASIRLRAPALASALDIGGDSVAGRLSALASISAPAGGAEEELVPPPRAQRHPIIPDAPFASFSHPNPRAIAASHRLSRSATIAGAMAKLNVLDRWAAGSNADAPLVVHVVGSDAVECGSEESLRAALCPLARWISAACATPPPRLIIKLIGPCVPPHAARRPPLPLLPPGGALVAVAVCVPCAYHDYLTAANAASAVGQRADRPCLAVAFNAGMWGYDSWVPTVRAMAQSCVPIPLIVTAYTEEEGEDDGDVLEDVAAGESVSGTGGGERLWGPEKNPFGSRVGRETATAPEGRAYRENGAWQAWVLGGGVAGGSGGEVK